jgi:glycyl-tRNA synthetase (class II)
MTQTSENVINQKNIVIVDYLTRHGFIFPSAEIYGGLAKS